MNTEVIDNEQRSADMAAVVLQQAGAASAMPPQRSLTVIEHAIKAGATPADLREIMTLQRDMDNHQIELMREKRRMDEEDRKRKAELAFRRDFAAFKGENIVIPKSKYVDRGRAGSFMQAEFGTASAMLAPTLAKFGFGVRFKEVFGSRRVMTDGKENDIPWVYVVCYLEHSDGHAETLDLEGPPGDMSANTPVQNMQVTASYLKRQGMLAITGTATQDEDNENGMRNTLPRAQRREPDAEAGDPSEAEALIDAGRAASMNGMAALNKWWASLTPRQQKDMGQDFGPMRKAARQVDEGAQR